MNILNQIAPPKFPPTMLEGLKFKPLFYGLADLMKKIVHRQGQENILAGLAEVVENSISNLPSEQADKLVENTAHLMEEVSQDRTSRERYSSIVAKLLRAARDMGEEGEEIIKILPELTKTIKFK